MEPKLDNFDVDVCRVVLTAFSESKKMREVFDEWWGMVTSEPDPIINSHNSFVEYAVGMTLPKLKKFMETTK